MFKLLIALSALVVISSAYGPAVRATKGEVWPKPQQEEKTSDYFIVRDYTFRFQGPADIGCPSLLDDAFTRYWSLIAATSASLERRVRRGKKHTKLWHLDESLLGNLKSLKVEVSDECTDDALPDFEDNENYTLTVNADGATLSAQTIWGALRGLETFSQLIYQEQDALVINATTITDFPRFSFRGLHLDTSIHFLPVNIILQTLDGMAYNKFNVFHWHLTDDQSFPYKSRVYPELSEKGAYHPVSKVFEPSDIAKVIEYARVRGIRVIPEFDTPGHTSSWGASHPELLTTCYSNNQPNGNLGPMDPSKDTTYDFINNLFTEVVGVFPDSYFHIGGDEVDFTCWQSNPDITTFMSDNNISSYEGLENYFIQHVVDLLDKLNSKYLVWEEVFVNGVTLPNTTLVHVWRGEGFDTLRDVTKAGKYGVFSSCWYLDHLSSGSDWQKFYECEPLNFDGTDEQKKLVLGGEACMWTESVNEYNVMPRVWPRACATAEKLWSAESVNDFGAARPRLEEHACRMNMRGIAAQPPNGPGFCL
ncbi:beta-hexosaminidase subunit alpha-like [Zophobas morio]|uniref:beta-hexosaminidase subunit alpha-like n=1 Tax=Zophobas morio TaxID=2755281 RepID=UPI003082B66C